VTDDPYLSVVVTARNDDHGGDLLARMQVFVRGLVAQCDRYRLPAELIVVEWNPPADRPGLADALEWPESSWCVTRIIEVPHELHATLDHADQLPLFQMIAKNVGIRRARGEFVLATNIDILFPDDLMAELARRELQHDRLYRVDRHDVALEPDPGLPFEEMLRRCPENVVRAYTRMSTDDLVSGGSSRIHPNPRLPLVLRRARYFALAARRRILLLRDYARATGAARRVELAKPPRVWHAIRDQMRSARLAWVGEPARLTLHTNASGDFTLLSRDAWFATRAYPELENYAMHIDGLFLYQANYAGIAEVYLRTPIFHIEHGTGGPSGDGALAATRARGEGQDAIPQVSTAQFMRWITQMGETKQPIAFNGDDWGFGSVTLRESGPAELRAKAPA
jgi:hypothetical protein